MEQENEKQPPPVETENQSRPQETDSASTEQRRRRPRRRYPRRRYYDRGDNSSSSYNESSNSSPVTVDPTGENPGVDALDRQSSEGGVETGEQVHHEPEFGEGIIEISGKGFGFLRDAKRNFVQA